MSLSERRLRDPVLQGADPDYCGSAVVDVACTLLCGRTADAYVAEGRAVPYWAWVNALARRPPAEVLSLAIARPDEPWSRATVAITAAPDRLEPAEVWAAGCGVRAGRARPHA